MLPSAELHAQTLKPSPFLSRLFLWQGAPPPAEIEAPVTVAVGLGGHELEMETAELLRDKEIAKKIEEEHEKMTENMVRDEKKELEEEKKDFESAESRFAEVTKEMKDKEQATLKAQEQEENKEMVEVQKKLRSASDEEKEKSELEVEKKKVEEEKEEMVEQKEKMVEEEKKTKEELKQHTAALNSEDEIEVAFNAEIANALAQIKGAVGVNADGDKQIQSAGSSGANYWNTHIESKVKQSEAHVMVPAEIEVHTKEVEAEKERVLEGERKQEEESVAFE